MGQFIQRCLLTAILIALCTTTLRAELSVDAPRVIVVGDTVDIHVRSDAAYATIELGGKREQIALENGEVHLFRAADEWRTMELRVTAGEETYEASVAAIPGWLTLLPALLAIGLALWLREVILSLLLGVLSGAWIAGGMTLGGLWSALLETIDRYILHALVPPDGDSSHISIIVFSLMIGGLVGLISRNGGTRGIVKWIAPRARTSQHGQTATGLLGLAVFFDDYANTLVVGGAMRPVADKLKISRAKLAYLVDSTAAPVSSLALITTWIGFQVGLLDEALKHTGLANDGGYALFLDMLPYNFYPLLAIAFVFVIALTGRDFGPMLKSERAAQRLGAEGSGHTPATAAGPEPEEEADMRPPEDIKHSALNAVIPIALLIAATIVGLFVTGGGDVARDFFGAGDEAARSIRDIIGAADSYKAILWASLLSVITAGLLGVVRRLMTLEEGVKAWFAGARSMLFAMVVLVMAWSLAAVNADLGTAGVITAGIGDWLPVFLLPALVFVLAAATAFATGSSWSVMSILIPIVVPLAAAMVGLDNPVFFMSAAAVLAGAVWGDHCSPVSDTTILSSMAAGCDHIEHVRTQLPYALLVGGTALFVCLVPVALGAPWWLMLPAAVGLLFFVMRRFGKQAGEASS